MITVQGILVILTLVVIVLIEIFGRRREEVTDYDEYLKSKHWEELKRKFYSDPDRRKCAICGQTHNLNLHHKTYKRLGHEKIDDLISLCEAHHHLVHEYIDKADKLGLNMTTDRIVRKYKKRLRKFKNPPTLIWKIKSKLNIPY